MVSKWKQYGNIMILLAVIAFVIIMESIAFLKLKDVDQHLPYLINSSVVSKSDLYPGFTFDRYSLIDMFTGQKFRKEEVLNDKIKYENGLIFFPKNCTNCQDTIRVLVSGGSTSDMTYIWDNWPKYLNDLSIDLDKCIEVCVASVAGYNSAQELMRISKDASFYSPDYHISYSGANESCCGYNFVWEMQYLEIWSKKESAFFMPNYFKLISMNKNTAPVEVFKKDHMLESGSEFWLNHMIAMQARAKVNGYKFIGILQPVVGIGGSTISDSTYYENDINGYRSIYPKMREFAGEYDFLYDFTEIFSGINDPIFSDACHLISTSSPSSPNIYQQMIAKKTLYLIDSLEQAEIN